MRRALGRLARDVGGAVAPTIALSLLGLVAAGGIAFDYARLASMDTELQDAADQAALAAATQLDGKTGACARAAQAASSLLSNNTLFANDNSGLAVTVANESACDAVGSIRFYSDYDPETGAKGPASTSDENANYVLVTVGARTANYALTPIVAALSSGPIRASAFATLDSAWCNLPPFMMCAPTPDFNPNDHIGAGVQMIIGSPNTPGNFGFLQSGFGTGANNLAKAIGWNGSAGGCIATRGMPTEPGDKQSVRAAINTRFDIFDNGNQTCPPGGTCSASRNARKDLVHTNNNNCATSGNNGWRETDNPYRRPDGTALTSGYPDVMGDPPDLCHMAQPNSCGIVGNGSWDRDAYFRVNYGWDAAGSGTANDWTTKTGLGANATRYQVYLWEAANPLPNGAGQPGLDTPSANFPAGHGQGHADSKAICAPPGVSPSNPEQDRRRTTVAVVNCSGGNPGGRDEVQPLAWMDVFLVEPSFRRPGRTNGDEVYGEIIRARPLPEIGQTLDGVVRRDVPKLLE